MSSHSLKGHLNRAGKEKCPSSSMGGVHLDLGSKWTVSRGNSAMCACQDLHMATMSRRRVAVKCFDFKHEKVIFLPFFCLYFSWSFWKEIRSASQIDHFLSSSAIWSVISNGHSSHFFNVTESLLYITYQHKPTEASLLASSWGASSHWRGSHILQPSLTSHCILGRGT